MHAIGIDIGTTSICGVLLDVTSGKILKQQTVLSEAFIQTENEWEKIQDVSKIMTLAEKILEELIDGECEVIGLTGQMHGILYTDREGRAISPLYTWQDQRGNRPYRERTYAAYMNSCSGYGSVTDFYNRENGLRPKEAVSYCTIQDYLGMVLCGLKRPVIHISDAASFGNFEPEGQRLPHAEAEVTESYRIIGKYRGIPVSVAIGDNQASVISTLAEEKDILVNVGTGSQVTIVSDRRIEGENIESRPYVEGKYLVVGAALCGGRAYSVLKNFYQEILQAAGADTSDVYKMMERMLTEEKDTVKETDITDELEVDTRFSGTRKDPNLRGNIVGISESNFRPQMLTRGVLVGMTKELYGMYREMNVSGQGLVGSGNGIRKNPKLKEMIEACFKEKVKIPVHKEEAAYGAALFGLVACGRFQNMAEAQKMITYN